MKSVFKLTAITLALVTTGAIAAAPAPKQAPSSPQINWSNIIGQNKTTGTGNTPPTAWEDKFVSSELKAKYGANSDVANAHAAGWKGQGVSIVTKTTDTTNGVAASFGMKVELIAPRSEHVFLGNTRNDGVSISNSVFSGFVASDDAMENYIGNPSVGATGIAIIGSDSTKKVAVSTGSYKGTAIAHDGRAPVVTFSNVDATINGNKINGIVEKTAYIVGSTAIIQSKFSNLSNLEVVANMDNSRTATGAFSLGRALAPNKALR